MNALQVAVIASRHPRMIALRHAQERMRRQFTNDYGTDFYRTDGQEGVNMLTPPQRKQWDSLMYRAAVLRAALRKHYANA